MNNHNNTRKWSLWVEPWIILLVVLSMSFGSLTFTSCNHNNYSDDVKLVFSTDTLMFDTIFTTVPSITRSFTVVNPGADPVKLDVFLAGGDQSYYSINVDGVAGKEFHGVEIAAHDSIFVFVKVNINPTNQNNPYLITDSVLFYNTHRKQSVQLVAFGQDAHFIIPDHTNSSMHYYIVAHEHEQVHWTNDKPWVVYGWAVVDSLGTLTIDPGTKIYFHHGGGLWVYRYGNIHVNGTVEEPVLFAGDRRESFYDTDYEQWDRIWINEGTSTNTIDNAIITNSAIGLQVSSLTEYLGNKTIVNNSVIHNNKMLGVLARASDLEMNNCQVSNNGSYSMLLQVGNFTLNHVTVANYFSQHARKEPAFALSNHYVENDTRILGNTTLTCNNCIIYGNMGVDADELGFSSFEGVELNYDFHNCLVKSNMLDAHFHNCINNKDPEFVSKFGQNYNIKETSPAIDAGKTGLGITTDILGRLRNGVPDIGAFEYYPEPEEKRAR